jgi:hypothetical protein
MDVTDYHAKYLAHELTRRCASDSVEKLAPVLAGAQVDLNPHQVEAALFAFQSPFSRGAILADEVGLGKTIEAGLLLAQKWAERKRRLLVILPANLRKQWSQELDDKFYLPSVILETKSFNEAVRTGNLNPFQQDAVVLCSYQFARNKEPYLRQTVWDLVVIDEAHRLRNVYKNTSKIALAIKQAIAPFPKVLLTATPLQNSLLELYGLVSIIDDFAFGDVQSYRTRFARLGNEDDFAELKERLAPLCKRTLRRQVLEYVKYTNRHALVQEFVPMTVSAMETEDHLFLAGSTDAGETLDEAQCRRLFDLPATVEGACSVPQPIATRLAEAHALRERALLEELAARNGRWLDFEMDKLDRWAEDRRSSLKATLEELDQALKTAKKAARLAPTLPEKLSRQREARELEGKRDEAWRAFDRASRDLDRQKDALLDEIGQQLTQKLELEPLFTLRWSLT